MNNILKAFLITVICAGAISVAEAKTTYRDAQGRIMGPSTTDRYGKTTYRDAQGRIQGSKK